MDDHRPGTYSTEIPEDDGKPKSKMIWLFVALCMLYHCERSMGQIVDGCETDRTYEVCWHYDLRQAWGRVNLKRSPTAPSTGNLNRVTGLIAPGAVIRFSERATGWGDLETDACSEVPEMIPGDPIGMFTEVGTQASVLFWLPAHFELAIQPVRVDSFVSAPLPNCALEPTVTRIFENFVSVSPISCIPTLSCMNPDAEPDKDVDLADFAAFQNSFVDLPESLRLPCFETFLQEFQGPTLSAC